MSRSPAKGQPVEVAEADPITALGDHVIGQSNKVNVRLKQVFWTSVAVALGLHFLTDTSQPGFLSEFVYSNPVFTEHVAKLPIFGNPHAALTFIAWFCIIRSWTGMWPNSFARWAQDHYSLTMQSCQVVNLIAFPCCGLLFIDAYKGWFWFNFSHGVVTAWTLQSRNDDRNVFHFWLFTRCWMTFFLGWAAHTVHSISNFYLALNVCGFLLGMAAFDSLGVSARRRAQ